MSPATFPPIRVDALGGVFPMLVTPFDREGNILWEDLDRLIDSQTITGAGGIATLGLLSETASLSEEERNRVAAHVLRRAGARAPVVVGVGAQDTRTACRLARAAAEGGAAALMVAPPAIPGINRERIREYYLDVAAVAGDCPLMIQDAPGFLGVALGAGGIRDLTDACPGIRYVKSEAVPSGETTDALVRALGPAIRVFGGMGGLNCLEVLDAGASGFIPGCELARVWTEVFGAYASGRRDQADAMYARVLPLVAFMYQGLEFGIACSKELLRQAGVLTSSATRSSGSLSAWSMRVLAYHAQRASVMGPGVWTDA
jgi:dihydrodipicolinate synthase/N-acetylneuraminate lyase